MELKSGRTRAWVVTAGLLFSVLADSALSGAELFDRLLFPNWERQLSDGYPPAIVFAFVLAWAGAAVVFSTLLTMISFLMWLYRTVDNARALGQRRIGVTPAMAVVWWFVPFANLVRPYRVIKALAKASETHVRLEHDWLARFPVLLPVWWAAWLIGSGLQNIGFRLASPGALRDQVASVYVSAAALPFVAVGACCLSAIIWSIQVRHDHAAQRGYTGLAEHEEVEEEEEE